MSAGQPSREGHSECSGALGLLTRRLNSGDGVRKQGGDGAGLTERRHPAGERKKLNEKVEFNRDDYFNLPAVIPDENIKPR